MQYFTVLLGIGIGIFSGRRLGEHILFLYYHYRFLSNENKFLDIYDLVDGEFHFQMYSASNDERPKKYADFLRLHQKCRPSAFDIYMNYINSLKKHTINRLIIFMLVPAVLLFWTTWYYYVVSFLFTVLAFSLYGRFKKDNGLDFHALLIVSLVFNDCSK